jgi:hypothetical protein
MEKRVEDIRREASMERPPAESGGSGEPPPVQTPQSGMSILLNIFLYILLLPTVLLLLARFLIG